MQGDLQSWGLRAPAPPRMTWADTGGRDQPAWDSKIESRAIFPSSHRSPTVSFGSGCNPTRLRASSRALNSSHGRTGFASGRCERCPSEEGRFDGRGTLEGKLSLVIDEGGGVLYDWSRGTSGASHKRRRVADDEGRGGFFGSQRVAASRAEKVTGPAAFFAGAGGL